MNPDQHQPDTVQAAASEPRPHVLVVDDSRVMRVALTRLLGKQYDVIEADDGAKAWQLLQEHHDIELVFSDLSMPGMDGFELLRRVRGAAAPHLSNLPFVVITGHEDDEGMQAKALELGASDFVSKPFRSAEITARAKTLTEQHRNVRELRQQLDEHATTDPVTGLTTASQFIAGFDQILSLAQRHSLPTACVLMHIDEFDAWRGQTAEPDADQVLRQLADGINELGRVEDATGYLGDGRFALAVSGADSNGANAMVARLAAELARRRENEPALPALSIGVATPPVESTATAEELLAIARENLAPLEPGQSDTADGQPELQQELEQARQAQQQAEAAERSKAEQLRTLQEGARQQLAKAHQTISTLRTQLGALQTKFQAYVQRFSQATQQQLEDENVQLRAILAEREEQLQEEQRMRNDAQQMLEVLRKQLADAKQEAEAPKSRGFLSGKLFGGKK